MSGEFLSGISHVDSCPRPAWVVSHHLLHDQQICKSFFQSARAFSGAGDVSTPFLDKMSVCSRMQDTSAVVSIVFM
jgi:hypothetical protein